MAKARKLEAAGRSSGDQSRMTGRFSSLGASGRHLGNLSRDFARMAHRNMHLPKTYSLRVPLRVHGEVETDQRIDMFLPHESMSWLAGRGRTHFESRLCPGGWPAVEEWWRERRREPWYDTHPAKQLLKSGVKVLPLQLYGDDAEMSKGGSALVFTYSSPNCALSSWSSKMLIAVVPLRICTDETLETIYACVRWSFDVLLSRRWPTHDCWGEPWTDWRRDKAGSLLCQDMECAGIIVRVLGDWKWLKEALGLTRYWKTRHICHMCCAVATIDKMATALTGCTRTSATRLGGG